MTLLKEWHEQLNKIPGVPIKGFFYRFIGIEYLSNPLGALQSKVTGGRYNFKGQFEVLYLAPDSVTAINEGQKEILDKFPPKAIITVEVDVKCIIDLEDRKIRDALKIDTCRLMESWRDIQRKGGESYPQTFGRIVYELDRFEGIRYPSAKVNGKYNLAIFPDKLKEVSQTSVYDPDKILKAIILRS